MYGIGRVLIEAPLMIETERVPASAIEWQGPGRILVALLLLLSAALLAQPQPQPSPAHQNARR